MTSYLYTKYMNRNNLYLSLHINLSTMVLCRLTSCKTMDTSNKNGNTLMLSTIGITCNELKRFKLRKYPEI